MLTRGAISEVVIDVGEEAVFFAQGHERLEPLWRLFSQVQDVCVLPTKQADPGAISFIMLLEMDFTDLDAMHFSLRSKGNEGDQP